MYNHLKVNDKRRLIMDVTRFKFSNLIVLLVFISLLLLFINPNLYLDKYVVYTLLGFSLTSIIIYTIVTTLSDSLITELKDSSTKNNNQENNEIKESSMILDKMIEELEHLNNIIIQKRVNTKEDYNEIERLVKRCSTVSKEIDLLLSKNL